MGGTKPTMDGLTAAVWANPIDIIRSQLTTLVIHCFGVGAEDPKP